MEANSTSKVSQQSYGRHDGGKSDETPIALGIAYQLHEGDSLADGDLVMLS